MNPGLWPAKRQSIPRMNATIEQASGKRAETRIMTELGVDVDYRLVCRLYSCSTALMCVFTLEMQILVLVGSWKGECIIYIYI